MRRLGLTVAAILVGFGLSINFAIADDWAECNGKDSDAALAACRRLISNGDLSYAQKTTLASTFNHRGQTFNLTGNFDRGLADLSLAIDLRPDFVIAWVNRAFSHGKKGDVDGAMADVNKAIELDPKNVQAYITRGTAFYFKKDYENAIVNFNKALALDPNQASAFDGLGHAYGKKGDYDQAVAYYTKALAIDPNNKSTANNLAEARKVLASQTKPRSIPP